jgi:hypothetical protein
MVQSTKNKIDGSWKKKLEEGKRSEACGEC